jgi:hypothetical protein
MKEVNETKLVAGTACLFSMFERAWSPTLGEFESPHKLWRERKTLVDGNCRILRWLGLVEPDRKLVFGCRPTERLERMFTRRRAHRLKDSKKVCASLEENDVLCSIFDAAVPFEERLYVCPLARVLLHVLGLVRCTQDGDEIPTHELRQLAAEGRQEERNRRFLRATKAGRWPPGVG